MLEIFHIQITWVIFQQFIRRDLKPVALPWLSLLEFSLLLPYSNLHKKTGIRFFSKKLLQKYLFKIPLWDKVMTPLLILTISSKNSKWKQHFHTCLTELNIKKATRQKQGTLMSNQCLICHCWCNVEELTVSSSSNLVAQHKVLC